MQKGFLMFGRSTWAHDAQVGARHESLSNENRKRPHSFKNVESQDSLKEFFFKKQIKPLSLSEGIPLPAHEFHREKVSSKFDEF
jgi:hypothetical protein